METAEGIRKMGRKNSIDANEVRIGWYFTESSTKNSPPSPTLLRNEGDTITLSLPISREDSFGEISRWFDGSYTSYEDDPDRTKYTYTPPSQFLFEDVRGAAALFHCRTLGKKLLLGGAAEGRIRVGFTILGARTLEYSRPDRMRTFIPGLAGWLNLSSFSIQRELYDNGKLKSVTVSTKDTQDRELTSQLFIGTSWTINTNDSSNRIEFNDPPFLESHIEGGADYLEHLKVHRLFRDLIDIAYWKPTGYFAIQCNIDSDMEMGSKKWREVKTFLVRPQETPLKGNPLFNLSHLGSSGFEKWESIRMKYDRAISPILSLLDLEKTAVETQFIQSCIGLEGLGVQLARDSNFKKQECLSFRLKRIVDDLGFSFSQDWPERTANTYNSIKHYDRDTTIDPIEAYYNLLENELVFRSWISTKIGIPANVILQRIELSDAAQTLMSQPGFNFPGPKNEEED